jgi:phenylalanyl-tRNA synthetase beta chain
MNIKITHSWLLEYLDTDATPQEIQKYLSLCGPSIERIEESNGETVYDIEITTNRIDTASVAGIAREAAAILPLFKKKAVLKDKTPKEQSFTGNSVEISITDPDGVCRRVLGVVLDVPNGAKTSPESISNKLLACGVRSLNNLVDITNYVMIETGHPTHVFDYDRIPSHKLILRHAKKGEKIVTLDEKEYALDETDIVIDDGTGRVIDLPGIMGTANSVVTPETKRILFFIESNDPVSIRRTSMRYGIRTMASTINEKNPDAELARTALLRGIELYQTVANATCISTIIDIYPHPAQKKIIKTSKSFIDAKVGVEIPLTTITSILKNLAFEVTSDSNGELTIEVPTNRAADVSIPEDIVEEVARVYGYYAIPTVLQQPAYVKQPVEAESLFTYQYAAKTYLKHKGFAEVMNYSATSLELLNQFGLEASEYIYITNSISEEIKYLRQSLIPSLVKNIQQNRGFTSSSRLFELAKIYIPQTGKLPHEEFMLTLATDQSFDHLKSVMRGLFDDMNIEMSLDQGGNNRYLLSSVQGTVKGSANLFGTFGQLKPEFGRALGIETPIYCAEFSFEELIKHAHQMPVYRAFSPFAHIALDLTLTKKAPYAEMEKKAFASSRFLKSVTYKGIYKDSITLGFVFTDGTRNLTEDQAKAELEKIKRNLS